jgi:tRNA threonylcarbamoyl adenosine modification protein YeaZ
VTARLALDAATDRLSVAVDHAGRVAERTLEGPRRHAGALLGMIDEALAAAGAVRRDIGLVAVADGPGSFTGLRVSFAAAKALVHDGTPLWTAPSLLVRAAGAAAPGRRVLAIAGALRGEAYAGAWQFELPDRITVLLAPRTVSRADLSRLPPVDRVVGEGPPDLVQALGGAEPVWPGAGMLLQLLGVPGGAFRVPAPALFEPAYGRPAEAQAKWEREHGRAFPDPDRRPG